MFNLQTVPLPVLPSNTKKFAMGRSRPPSAFKISWASIPPTIAHIGENSKQAVVDKDLQRDGVFSQMKRLTETHSMRSREAVAKICWFTFAVAMS